MKQYSKVRLQCGQRGRADLKRNPVRRHVYTEENQNQKTRDHWNKYTVGISWWILVYMVKNTANIFFFPEIQMKIILLIQVIGFCKIRSYTGTKYAILMLLVLHIPHCKNLWIFSINLKHLGRFFLKSSLHFQSRGELSRETISGFCLSCGICL